MLSLGKEPVPEISFTKSFSFNTPHTWTALQTFGYGILQNGDGVPIPSIAANQGLFIDWNVSAAYGETNFYNNHGGAPNNTAGSGGFRFYDDTNGRAWTEIGSMDELGNFSVIGAGTFAGLLTASAGLTAAGLINANGNLAIPSTTVAGTTAGELVAGEPFVSTGYKKVVISMDGYENTTAVAQIITFPTAFTTVSVIISNLTAIAVTLTNTNLTFPTAMTAAVTGVIIIEGY